MLIIARNLGELSFGKLMDVYYEGNLENGADRWPGEPESRQIALAEQDFYKYLQQVFFSAEGARYLIWEEQGKYVSALRLEPWRDGLLLEALETAPDQRRKGYAKTLIRAALEQMGDLKIYSHVSKRNTPSLKTHEACGFKKILDYAVYLDGSVLRHMDTLCFDPKEK